MINKSSIWVALLTLCLLTMMILPVFATGIEDALKELDQIEQQRKQKEQDEKFAKTRFNELGIQLEKLNTQLTKAQLDLDRLNSSIRRQEQRIADQQALVEATEQEIYETELYLEEQTLYLEKRLRAMYLNGTVSYLDVLFSSSGFIDFISRFNFIRSIIESDVELVTEVKNAREKLEQDKTFLQVELVAQVQRRSELETARRQAFEEEARVQGMVAQQKSLQTDIQKELASIASELKVLEQEEAEVTALLKKLEEEARLAAGAPPGSYHWPTPGFTFISSRYGWRTLYGQPNYHRGIDIAIPHRFWPGSPWYEGTPAWIVAAAGGKVELVRYSPNGYGWYAMVNHGGGHATIYAHMHQRPIVIEGQMVTAGQRLGIVGSTGNSTGPHLHFEIIVSGERKDPLTFTFYNKN